MKKEHVKNIVLTFLVVTNLVLGSNILIDKKLWPSGYNFFNIENFNIIKWFVKNNDDKDNFEKAVHLTLPEKIIFNTGDQTTRFSVNSNNKEYNTIIEYSNEILGTALSSEESRITEVTSDEWFSSLMSNSVYLNYYTEYDTELFANFLGFRETAVSQKVDNFSNVVIALSDNVSVYIEDIETKKYYKIRTGRKFEEFKTVVTEMVNSQNYNNSEQSAINYSFDLNFDVAFGGQKAIIDSMVPIYSDVQNVPVVLAKNIITKDGKIENNIIEKIAQIFNVNANTVNRYTEADETVVYVENNATLKIHTDGIVEYKARDEGIQLTDSQNSYNIISRLNEFVLKVNEVTNSNDNIYLSSKAADGENVITFDYICEGMPVKISIGDMNNAVYCVVSDGYLKEYKHVLRGYEKTGEYITTPEYIKAVDETIQEYSDVTGEITINKLYLAYKDNGKNQSLSADWNTEVKAVILEDKVE